MRISYLSDTHLDFHQDRGVSFLQSLEVPETDLLVIAGDMCDLPLVDPTYALNTLCNKAPHVLYVLGNHEYYHSTPKKTEDHIFGIASKFSNLTVAGQPKMFTLNGVKFLAGTMWFQDLPDNILYKKYLNDFYQINLLEPRIYYDHKDFVKALEQRPEVVVTHHLPSYRSVDPKFAGSIINRFFVGEELEKKIEKYKHRAWIHGHSHEQVRYRINGCQIVSNPFGYPNEVKANWKVETISV